MSNQKVQVAGVVKAHKGRITAFICENLHTTICVENSGIGVIPMSFMCPSCGTMSTLLASKVNQKIKPDFEWRQVKPEEKISMDKKSFEWASKGGLVLAILEENEENE